VRIRVSGTRRSQDELFDLTRVFEGEELGYSSAHGMTAHDCLLGADMILADGMSVVWASRLVRAPLPERVAGIDLMLRMLELCEARKFRVYCLGATDAVLASGEQMLLHVDTGAQRACPAAPEVLAKVEEIRAAQAALPRPEDAGRAIGIGRAA